MMSLLLSLLLTLRTWVRSRATMQLEVLASARRGQRASDRGMDRTTDREAFPWDEAPRYLIHDRDQAFASLGATAMGIEEVLTAPRAPWQNAFAERFVLSVKSECLDRIVPLGEAHLRAAVHAFVAHYHKERPHQGLDNERIAPTTTSTGLGPIPCRERLGGMLRFYYRDAA